MMKKMFSLILVCAMLFSLTSCGGPSVKELAANADTYIAEHQPEEGYLLTGEFSKEDSVYTVVMTVDKEAVEKSLKDADSSKLGDFADKLTGGKFGDALLDAALAAMNSDSAAIGEELKDAKDAVLEIFGEKEITVKTYFVDSNGKKTEYEF